MIAACALGMQRLVVEECLKYVWYHRALSLILIPERWTNQRIAFGKPLHAQAVVRAKLAGMISRVESSQNWIESVTYQMNNVSPRPMHGAKSSITCLAQMSYHEQSDKLAGAIGLLKQSVPFHIP